MSVFKEANEKIENTVVEGYQKVENAVVGGYKKVEDTVVSGYKKMEDTFIEKFLAREGETAAEARERLTGEEEQK